MLKRSAKLAILACLIAGLVGTSTAQASDAGLRKVVKRQETRVAPAARKFGAADKALAQAPDTSAASAAATALRKGLRGFKTAVVPIRTQTPTAALAKKKLLKALREFDLGLVQYQTLLDKANAGASKDSLKQSFVTLNKRISAAAKNETAALRLLSSQR